MSWDILSNLITTQSGSLKSYLRHQYGVHTQKAVGVFGKELDRLAGFTNYHHFNLRVYNSGIVPPSLKIKAPVNSERACAAAARASRIFTQERVKSAWRAGSQLWVMSKVAGKIFVLLSIQRRLRESGEDLQALS